MLSEGGVLVYVIKKGSWAWLISKNKMKDSSGRRVHLAKGDELEIQGGGGGGKEGALKPYTRRRKERQSHARRRKYPATRGGLGKKRKNIH